MNPLLLNILKKHLLGMEQESSKIRLDPLPGIIAPTAAPEIPKGKPQEAKDEQAQYLQQLYARFQKSQEGKPPRPNVKKSLDGS